MNNLSAIDEAARLLQSKGGFKLYMYFAKNQNKYAFALSSSDFMEWSGLAYSAYTSAFKELVQHGFLVQNPKKENEYFFYDKPCLAEEIEKLEQQKAEFTFNKNLSRTGFNF